MEQLDQELQKRVWERVQGREKADMPPLRQDNLKPWMMTAQENAAAYQQLARQMTGKHAEQLKKLEQETQKCIACMRGICRLRGEKVKVPALTAPKEPAQRTLEKCYHRERRLWEEAERRASDPEHGIIFGKLSRQAGERCAVLLEILGRME